MESEIQHMIKEYRIPLTIEIRNSLSTDKESRIQYLESRTHGVETVLDSLTWNENGPSAGLGHVTIRKQKLWGRALKMP